MSTLPPLSKRHGSSVGSMDDSRVEEGTTSKRGKRKSEDPFAAGVKRFEVEKKHLVTRVARDREKAKKLRARIDEIKEQLEARRERLANTSAMFLHGESKEEAEVEMHRSDGGIMKKKVVVKPLGRRDAVSEVRRMIRKTLDQIRKDSAVAEVKLNKALDRNERLRESVNALRREKIVYNKVFQRMETELEEVKAKVSGTEDEIAETYAARDVCRREAQEVIERVQTDRAEASAEWARLEAEMTTADKKIDSVEEGGAGALTSEEEADLARRISEAEVEISKNTRVLEATKAKIAAFEDALAVVRSGTGFDDLDEFMEQIERLEEEKLEKVGATTRVMEEIEQIEMEIQNMKTDVGRRETEQTEVAEKREEELGALQKEAEAVEELIRTQHTEVRDLQSDISFLLPQVETLFSSLGCELLVEESAAQGNFASPKDPRPQSVASAGSNESPASVSSRRSARGSIHAGHSVREAIGEGISPSNVVQFIALIDERAANLVQMFAYYMSEGRISPSILNNQSPSNGADEEIIDQVSSRQGEESKQEQSSSLRVTDYPRSPVRLGPSNPAGALAKSLTSSALLAAIIDPSILSPPLAEDEEDSRPLSLDEIKAHAERSISSKTVELAVAASRDAADQLIRRHDRRVRRKAAAAQ